MNATPNTSNIHTVTVVGDDQDTTFTTVAPSYAAAIAYLRDQFPAIPETLADDQVVDALNTDRSLTAGDPVRFVMVEGHQL